jgi:hypothetical protein
MSGSSILAISGVLLAAADCRADAPLVTSMACLKKMSLHELDCLFENAGPGAMPQGAGHGQVLLLTKARHPKLAARLANGLWKGKHVEDDGSFVNQFPGFRALHGHCQPGTSWHDEKPCFVLDYPPGTPLFGNLRDEMREIAPGLYLARLYERCPCPRFIGYFALQTCAAGH